MRVTRDPLAQLPDRGPGETEHQDLPGFEGVLLVTRQCVKAAHQRVGLTGARSGGDQEPGVPGLVHDRLLLFAQWRTVQVRVAHLVPHRCSNCVKASFPP